MKKVDRKDETSKERAERVHEFMEVLLDTAKGYTTKHPEVTFGDYTFSLAVMLGGATVIDSCCTEHAWSNLARIEKLLRASFAEELAQREKEEARQ